MKNCTNCKYAEWYRTDSGRLHPSGDGRCKYEIKIPKLPASMFWYPADPKPYGGHINRRKELEEDCVYFTRKER